MRCTSYVRGLVVALVAIALGCSTARADLFVFGDSLSDTGNVYKNGTLKVTQESVFGTKTLYDGAANFPGPTPPKNFGIKQLDDSLTKAYNYTTGRFTDGADTNAKSKISGVWVEQLAAKMKMALPTASTTGGTNYAWGGAETKDGSTAIPKTEQGTSLGVTVTVTANVTVQNLGGQIDAFQKALNGKKADAKSIYTVWAGGNDLINTMDQIVLAKLGAATLKMSEQTAIANIVKDIQRLYDLGARCILWPDLPPLELLPRYKNLVLPLHDVLASASAAFKTDEEAAIKTLTAKDAGLMLTELDVHGLFNTALGDPKKYGFTNINTPAQGLNVNPDQYVFWDDIHPTTKTHQLIAGAGYDALVAAGCFKPAPEPSSMALAFAAILPIGIWLVRSRRSQVARP
jgi:phospholipase/lecithinase/hemolysin